MKNLKITYHFKIIGSLALFAVFMQFSMTSCQQEDLVDPQEVSVLEQIEIVSRNNLPNLYEHYQRISQESDGVINLKATATWATQHTGGTERVQAVLLNEENTATDYGPIQIGELELEANPEQGYQYNAASRHAGRHLYGQEISVKIPEADFETNLYIPKEISITEPEYHVDATLASNSTIHWNVDPNNQFGVLITVDYVPSNPANQIFIEEGYADRVTIPILVDDLGHYTFKRQDFVGIPTSANIKVRLLRGNYAVSSNGERNKEFTVLSHSQVIGNFIYTGE